MKGIERALTALRVMHDGSGNCRVTPLCMLLVGFCYLIAMLSVPPEALTMLLWYALFPIVGASLLRLDFTQIFLRSLFVLPFAVLIGLFNPIFDTAPAMQAGNCVITRGWISFISITVRAVLSVQALLIVTSAAGFTGLCRSLRRLKVPVFLTTQLLMVYRYLTVLLEEALDMRRAREARGYGQNRMPLKMWGAFIGQLSLRTMARADRIHRAMLARGFDGVMPAAFGSEEKRWSARDSVTLIISIGFFLLFRFCDLSTLFGFK